MTDTGPESGQDSPEQDYPISKSRVAGFGLE